MLELQEKHPLIGEVRGMGLMLGRRTGPDRVRKNPPTTEAADRDGEDERTHGVLVGKGGLYGNTLRIKPPMCITKDDADYLVATAWSSCSTSPKKRVERTDGHRRTRRTASESYSVSFVLLSCPFCVVPHRTGKRRRVMPTLRNHRRRPEAPQPVRHRLGPPGNQRQGHRPRVRRRLGRCHLQDGVARRRRR